MKKMFKWATPLLAATVVLAACGSDDTSKGGSSDGGEEKKVYTAGTEATFAPFEYLDTNGNVVGIDKEILDAIGAEMGVEIQLENIGWDLVFEQVRSGGKDIGASGITITDERKEAYDFTDPYFEATQYILVPEDSDITSLADLEGKKISAQINTTGHIAAKKAFGETNPDIKAFENFPSAVMEMLNGGADATIGDNAVALEYMKNNPDAKLKVIEDEAFEKEYYGLMVKKGNTELLELLNEGLAKIKENGKLKEITGQDLQ